MQAALAALLLPWLQQRVGLQREHGLYLSAHIEQDGAERGPCFGVEVERDVGEYVVHVVVVLVEERQREQPRVAAGAKAGYTRGFDRIECASGGMGSMGQVVEGEGKESER